MNAVHYAENELGVHDVWEHHADSVNVLADAHRDHDLTRRRIRSLKEQIADREFELLNDLSASDPEASATARNQALKRTGRSDPKMSELRRELEASENDQDEHASVIKVAEYDLRGIAARMEELAGLLRFYAVTKEEALRAD